MLKIVHRKAQAATELAVFGAILIFLLGTIIRSAVGSSYTQNQNFKAMRMAMLASWNGSKSHPGMNPQNISHNSSQILFIEDRLTPDYNKYGDLDRIPFLASGSGTFSYNVLYPLSNAADVKASLPVMDMYVNGQHFPFAVASYVPDLPIIAPQACPAASGPSGTCSQNQCLRNQREWAGGIVKESSFVSTSIAPMKPLTANCPSLSPASAQRICQEQNNACTVFTGLAAAGIFKSGAVAPGGGCTDTTQGVIDPAAEPLASSSQWSAFINGPLGYEASFPNTTKKSNADFYAPYLQTILQILQGKNRSYKLFYTMVANPGGTAKSQFTLAYPGNPQPNCPSHPCKDKELSPDVPLLGYDGLPTTDGNGKSTNVDGVMQYDLLRNADYSADPAGVWSNLSTTSCPVGCLRNYMGWQWAATAGTTADMIGLDKTNNVYPNYDVDGRLKEVTIYDIWQDTANVTHVAFEDGQGGDIDQTWDSNSCGPKPGLKSNSQIFTFTQNGTYLQINEGKLYNPETGQVVRSANKRDSIDLIQRTVQLSNNTGRFCTNATPPVLLNCVGNASALAKDCSADPNPVEVCVGENPNDASDNCFTSANIAKTCYDTNLNVIFIRSRLEDRRGGFWMTNTSGQLKVQ